MAKKRKMTKKRKAELKRFASSVAIVVALVAVLGFGVAKATMSFDEMVAKWTGFYNSEKMASAGSLEVPAPVKAVEEVKLGAGAHAKTGKQLATVSLTSATVTTSIQNGDSDNRIIDKVIWYASTTVGVQNDTQTINFALSTDGVTASNDLGLESAALVTTTPNYNVTSTFGVVSERVWIPNEYVIVYLGAGITTTEGFFGVEYHKP